MEEQEGKRKSVRREQGREKTLKRVRVKKNRHRRRKIVSRLAPVFPDLLIVAGLGLSLLFLVNPFPWLSARIGSGRVLAGIGGAEIAGAPAVPLAGLLLVFVVLIAAFFRLRHRSLFHQAWWKTTCPECGSNALRRTPRLTRDRLLGKMGVPVRRYICADCHWTGARIDQTRIP